MVALVFGILKVAIRDDRTDSLAALPLGSLHRADFLTRIGGIEIVEIISYALHLVYAVGTVHAIIDCDKSDIVGREGYLHKSACFKVISAKMGLVFYYTY